MQTEVYTEHQCTTSSQSSHLLVTVVQLISFNERLSKEAKAFSFLRNSSLFLSTLNQGHAYSFRRGD